MNAGDKAGFTNTGKGNYEGVINRTFEIQPKSVANGKCEIPSQVYTGSDVTPGVTVSVDGKVLVAGRDYMVVYSDNRDVTTADHKASAVITAMGNYTGKLIVQFEITAKTILPADVSDIEAQEYTGSAIEPKVTVKNGTTILVAGRDYDVAYSDNVDKTKSAKAVITGKGNYRGVVAKTFEICATSIASAVVTGIPENAVYTGESITFDDIKVQLGGKTMVYGSDYSISYERNVNATTDESVRDQISTAITALQNAQTAADGLNNVQKASAITVSVPTFDLSAITSGAATLQTTLKTFKETAAALQQQLPEMQKKLDAIAAAKDSLPSESISQLTASVTQLNQGMQGLNTGLGTLSGGLGQLNTSVQAQFPTAIQGITELNGGFMQLGSYNTSLLSGAEKLKGSSSTLAAGAGTLQSGTNQLASGLNTLGSQMSAGAAKLSANSNALREGASSLSEGAKKLADGMDQFDKEGTSKLKSTVEDEFGDVLDRLKALTSDDCTYNTFSGKDSKMDGSVKFVIETEAIE